MSSSVSRRINGTNYVVGVAKKWRNRTMSPQIDGSESRRSCKRGGGAMHCSPSGSEGGSAATRTVTGQKITGDESPVVPNSDAALGIIAAGGLNTDAASTAAGTVGSAPFDGNFITTGSGTNRRGSSQKTASLCQRESATIDSSSSGSLGIASERTRQPSSVTRTSSSMRMPIPR